MQRERICICCHCGSPFKPNPRVKNQKYCSEADCQRCRKREWQRAKMQTDSCYRENQRSAQKKWRSKNPDYYQDYRRKNPVYTARNREQQRTRNKKRANLLSGSDQIAKMDASASQPSVIPGTYQLVPTQQGEIAKMDALIVQLSVLSQVTSPVIDCKDRTR